MMAKSTFINQAFLATPANCAFLLLSMALQEKIPKKFLENRNVLKKSCTIFERLTQCIPPRKLDLLQASLSFYFEFKRERGL